MRGDSEHVADDLRAHLEATPPSGLISAYVFGSHAEGRDHRESDLDVGILLAREAYPGARERFELRVSLSASLGAHLGGTDVDVVVLKDAPPHLGRHIVATGRRVFCSDDAIDHAFVRDVQVRAADLEPFLQRMRRLKLEALGR